MIFSNGSRKQRRDVKRPEFRNRVFLGFLFLILSSTCIWWSNLKSFFNNDITKPSSGLNELRRETLDFVQQYKHQLSVDFGHLNSLTPVESSVGSTNTPIVEEFADRSSVVHSDSGPLPKNSFTTISDVVVNPKNSPELVSHNSQKRHSSQSGGAARGGGGPSSSNIVIGMAQDTDPKNLVTFCASLREHSEADVVLFMNLPISQRNEEIVKKYNINVIPFDVNKFGTDFQSYHPSTLRWLMMDNFFQIETNRKKYEYVWMIDVRDSMFQDDPFKMISNEHSAFFAFKGVEDKTISQCGWNGGWIRDCFGHTKLNQVGHNNIICSGVSVGTMDVVVKYLKSMRSIVEGKDKDAKFPSCERNGVDQGIHNVLVHTGKIENLKIFSQYDSPVLNLQARIAKVDEQKGIVRNNAGRIAAVIHQYDRYPSLQRVLFEKYAYWIDFSDPMYEWNTDADCHRFEYVKDVDLFRGICDYKIKGGMTGPNSCCSLCTKLADCSSFTFYQGQCFLKKGCGGKTRNNKAGRLGGAVSAYLK